MANSIAEDFKLAAAVAAILLFGNTLARGALAIWKRTIGARREAEQKVRALACCVGRRFVEQLLGAPAFHFERKGLHEDIYILSTGYVQTVSDPDGTVLRYSVTATDPRWHPRLGDDVVRRREKKRGIRLCKTRFVNLDIDYHIQEVELSIGARLAWYRERYYYGNPGFYQHYILSFSPAGTWKHIDLDAGMVAVDGAPYRTLRSISEDVIKGLFASKLKVFREHTAINTFTVIAPNISPKGFESFSLGPNPDLVRVLSGRPKRGFQA